MINLLSMFRRRRTTDDLTTIPVTMDEAVARAMALSLQVLNHNRVIVVVEAPGHFDFHTRTLKARHFQVYQYRGYGDYNRLPDLKAAFMNGRRIERVGRIPYRRASNRHAVGF